MKIKISGKFAVKIAALAILVGGAVAAVIYMGSAGSKVAWTFQPPRRASAAVTVADDLILLGTEIGIYAIEKDTGKQRWRFGCDAVKSRPVVANGFVYFATLSGRLYAVDLARGEERWRWDGARGYHFDPSTPVAIDGNTVITPGPGSLVGLDAVTGTELWRKEVSVQSPVAVADGTIHFATGEASDEPKLFCALEAASRQEKWKWAPQRTDACSAPAVTGRAVWFWSHNRQTGNAYVYAFDVHSGNDKFRLDAGSEPLFPVAAVGGTAFVVGASGVIAIDLDTGRELWTFSPPNPCVGPAGIESKGDGKDGGDGNAGDRKVLVTTKKFLYVLNAATGESLKTIEMLSPPGFVPAAADRVIYALDARGLRAVK